MESNPFRRLARIYTQAFSEKQHSHRWLQDDVLDTLYWLRQALGLLQGLLWGLLPITGMIGFLSHLVIGTLFIYGWCKREGLDEDDYGGVGPLLTEGMAPSISVFMLTWISVYSTVHY